MPTKSPRILGTGFAVPDKIRTNDDPIFDWIKKNNPAGMALFTGYDERRVLGQGEDLMTIMVPAAQSAMQNAGLKPDQIDMLIGYGSVGEFQNPNDLSLLNAHLGLSANCWTVALNNEFSNFNAAIYFADALIRAGRVGKVLVCVGCNWTQHVDYHTAQSVSAADGAAAAVIGTCGEKAQWQIVDSETINDFSYYNSMFMKGMPVDAPDGKTLWTNPVYQITQRGIDGFKAFGGIQTPQAALAVMKRHGLTGADIALVSHQASSVLLEQWQTAIQPAQYFNTIAQYANVTLSNVPLNLARATQQNYFTKDWLVLLAVGADMHANALLLRRNFAG